VFNVPGAGGFGRGAFGLGLSGAGDACAFAKNAKQPSAKTMRQNGVIFLNWGMSAFICFFLSSFSPAELILGLRGLEKAKNLSGEKSCA
jgi:hypothetical protein